MPPFPTLATGPHTDVTGGGPFQVAPGQVTDDTHMACCLAASLAEVGRFEGADVARRYVAWRRHTFDIGTTTSAAVRLLAAGHLDAGRRVWEDSGRRAAANGSLMRTAPIGVFHRHDAGARRRAALDDSALTHFDPRCRLACAALDAAIAHAIEDDGAASDAPARALSAGEAEVALGAQLLVAEHPDLQAVIAEAAADLLDDLRLARADDPGLTALIHGAEGFVRVAFRLAFWELVHAPGYAAGLIDVVNRGGDADTNGAIAGALLGAVHGEPAIPAPWIQRVLGALQERPPGPLRDDYHPKVLLRMLDAMREPNGGDDLRPRR